MQGKVSAPTTNDYDRNNALHDRALLRTGLLAHRFAQQFTYDARGAVLTETHPDCEDYTSGSIVNCTGNPFTTTNTYAKGMAHRRGVARKHRRRHHIRA